MNKLAVVLSVVALVLSIFSFAVKCREFGAVNGPGKTVTITEIPKSMIDVPEKLDDLYAFNNLTYWSRPLLEYCAYEYAHAELQYICDGKVVWKKTIQLDSSTDAHGMVISPEKLDIIYKQGNEKENPRIFYCLIKDNGKSRCSTTFELDSEHQPSKQAGCWSLGDKETPWEEVNLLFSCGKDGGRCSTDVNDPDNYEKLILQFIPRKK